MGGVGTYTYECARALALAGHETHVFTLTLPADIRAQTPAGVVVHEVSDLAQRVDDGHLPGALAAAVPAGGEGVYRLALAWLLCEAVRAEHQLRPLDIVEAPDYEALGLPLLLNPVGGPGVAGGGGIGGGLPVVTQIHLGTAIWRECNAVPTTPESRLFEALELAAITVADGLCSPTKQVVTDLRRHVPIPGDVAALPLPFQMEEDAGFQEPPAGGSIVYIGRLERIKGAELLAQALVHFSERCPEVRVKLAGPDTATAPGGSMGSMAEWMRQQWPPQIAQQVEFLGEVTQAQIKQLLADAAFCVVPSLYDSYSFVCCAALAAGRAVVVSDGIGATEVVGDAGVTFERGNAAALAQALENLWRDRPRQVALGQRAYQRARTSLSYEVTLPARLTFYQEIIAKMQRGERRPWWEKLTTFPAGYGAALIGSLVGLTGGLCGIVNQERPTPGGRLLKLLDELVQDGRVGGGGAKVYLYGAGRHTARLLAQKYLWEQRGHAVVGLIDDHPRFKESGRYGDLPVVSREVFEQRIRAGDLRDVGAVVLSTDTFQEQFWEQTTGLRELGVRVLRLYEVSGKR